MQGLIEGPAPSIRAVSAKRTHFDFQCARAFQIRSNLVPFPWSSARVSCGFAPMLAAVSRDGGLPMGRSDPHGELLSRVGVRNCANFATLLMLPANLSERLSTQGRKLLRGSGRVSIRGEPSPIQDRLADPGSLRFRRGDIIHGGDDTMTFELEQLKENGEMTCSIQRCPNKPVVRGLCRKHYMRARHR